MHKTQTIAEFSAEMNARASAKPDAGPVLRAAVPIIKADEAQRFATDTSPDGVPWAPHAPYTVKKYGPHDLLELSGALKAATLGEGDGHVERIEGDTLSYGVDGSTNLGGIPFAIVQQEGSDSRNIPARPFIGLSSDAIDQITNEAADLELATWN